MNFQPKLCQVLGNFFILNPILKDGSFFDKKNIKCRFEFGPCWKPIVVVLGRYFLNK